MAKITHQGATECSDPGHADRTRAAVEVAASRQAHDEVVARQRQQRAAAVPASAPSARPELSFAAGRARREAEAAQRRRREVARAVAVLEAGDLDDDERTVLRALAGPAPGRSSSAPLA